MVIFILKSEISYGKSFVGWGSAVRPVANAVPPTLVKAGGMPVAKPRPPGGPTMPTTEGDFREARPGDAPPIRDLGLTIDGSDLGPVVAEFRDELRRLGLDRVQ